MDIAYMLMTFKKNQLYQMIKYNFLLKNKYLEKLSQIHYIELNFLLIKQNLLAF